MFGARQLEWLKAALLRSRAPVKIIAGGSQFWNRASRFEGWHRFPTEQKAFAAWLAEQRIDGVIFVSGDRHFTELLRIERPGAYPLYEFTSSPLTSRPLGAARPGRAREPGRRAGHAGRQAAVRPDPRVSGPGNDRRVALESYDATGARLWRHEIRARDLRMPRRSPAPDVAPGAAAAATAAPAAAAETDDE